MGKHQTRCDFCGTAAILWDLEEIALRQSSDRGYVRYRATLVVGNCAQCDTKSFDAEANRILDAAFQREYDRLPAASRSGRAP
jgi:hypothetical protein